MANRMMFVNLPVRDLERAKSFFGKLGFSFNPRFTDDKAACMVVSDLGYVMLLQEAFYRTFTKRPLCDTTRQNEGLVALSCQSRGEVDALVRAALEAGGSQAMEPMDHGFMYERSFYDPDGHHWEVVWMDPKVAQGQEPVPSARS
ncbi:MAG TPA: VOC family protein [Anaeromyxobacteraceae bacterium]|nr:VOC family protein [Anaeromyxobacteraceae bacterium]